MSTSPPRLLFVTLSNIGDMVMTTPVLETLNRHYPDALIDIVADARSSSLLRAAPYVGDIFHREKRAGLRSQLALLKALRRRSYVAAVDMRTPLIPYLVRTQRRFARRGRRAQGVHAAVEHYAVIADLHAGQPTPPACRLYLDGDALARAEALLGACPGNRWLCVAPGANWPGKCWPTHAYGRMLDELENDFDCAIVLGNDADRPAAEALAGSRLSIVDMTGRTDLPVAAALLARGTAFVGNDSGLGHMAAAVGLPTVTVFGPGEPERYRPWGPRAVVALAPGADFAALDPARVAALVRTQSR